jgi:hypothetical protein
LGCIPTSGRDGHTPSIRTIARQAGLSRQTVLTAIAELTSGGLLATSKSQGRSTAYKIIRQAPERSRRKRDQSEKALETGQKILGERPETGLISLGEQRETGLESYPDLAQFFGPPGPSAGPKQDPGTREDSASIPIPGTPFRLTAQGRLLVAVDLQQLLTSQGLPRRLAERLATQKAPEDVAKVLLNALYLQSQGKLQNGPGYIRAGIEDGYELLPQVANRLENQRRELEQQLRGVASKREQRREESVRAAEEEAINLVIASLRADELQDLIDRAVAALPEPIVRRNPTLSNPFVRTKVYELAGGDPLM